MTTFNFTKLAATAGAVLAVAMSAPAFAAPQFTFDASGTGKTTGPTTFTADQLSGLSSELITFAANPLGENSASGYLIFTNATLTGHTPIPVVQNFYGGNYGLYLTFSLTNHLVQQNAAGNTYALDSLTFNFYIDKSGNTSFQAPVAQGGTPAIVNGNTADDVLIATGSLYGPAASSNIANINGQGSGATVGLTSTESFVNPNTQYFTAPFPFYTLAFNSFANNGGAYTQSSNGAFGAINNANGNVSFSNVPEPDSLALVAIALIGMGVAARRRKS